MPTYSQPADSDELHPETVKDIARNARQERGMLLALVLLVISHATLAVVVLSNEPRLLAVGGFVAGLCCLPVILTIGGWPILYGRDSK